jgi:hypothetical protein
MRVLLVVIGLAVSPSPAPSEAALAAEFAADLVEATHCNAMAMEKHAADPLSSFLDVHRAPGVDVIACDGSKQRLKNGYQARSWAYTHCRVPGLSKSPEPPPPGAVTCKDRCCDVENSVRVCFDKQMRINRIEYRCAQK